MAVNLLPPKPEDLLSIAGVRLGIARAHVRKPDRKDMLLLALDEGCRTAGVFTRNRYAAAPVLLCREHLDSGMPARAVLVNTGVANAGTGETGIANARATCVAAAAALGIRPEQVLPLSTGVIMEPLPVERVTAGIPACVADLAPGNWASAAEAIMTTDTVPKAVSRQVVIDGRTITVTGIAKGAGMIEPNMATMLGIIATDACVSADVLQYLARRVANRSFNAITVDGDTSTNDTLLVIASCRGGNPEIKGEGTAEFGQLAVTVVEVAQLLAQAIVRDGEGVHHVVTVRIKGAASEASARAIARRVATSPLVKTAIAGGDPNWGRILCAIGNAGVPIKPDRLDLWIEDLRIVAAGAVAAEHDEAKAAAMMKQAAYTITADLHAGRAEAHYLACDLSHEYVSINADYRS